MNNVKKIAVSLLILGVMQDLHRRRLIIMDPSQTQRCG